MKQYTEKEIEKIPNIFKGHWYKEWIEEQKKPKEYEGKFAILVKCGKGNVEPVWETEGIDFEIVESR